MSENELPKGWAIIELKSVFEYQNKSKRKAGEGENTGKYKFFTSSALQRKYMDSFDFDKKALIFGTGGKANVHYCEDKFSTSTDCVVVYCHNERINLKFIYYYLLGNINILQKGFKGIGLQHVSKNYISSIKIPLPTRNEQELIISKIEQLLSELDNGVAELQKIKLQLKVYRQAVLKYAFEGKLTDSNIEDWEICKLVNLVEKIFDGPFGSNLKTSDYTVDGIRVVRLENLKNLWFDDSKKSFVSIEKYQTIKQHTIFPSDLIMSTFISSEIKVCQMPQNINFAINKADCVCIRVKEDVEKKYILYYLSSEKVYSDLYSIVHGATRPRVNTKQIKQITMPLAPIKEQKQIVIEIESRLSVCDKIEQIVYESLLKSESLRQSILKKAFTGKLLLDKEV